MKEHEEEAFKKVIRKISTINLRAVKVNHIGLPRSGKTSFLLRLMGVILNLLESNERGMKEQSSTGVAEEGAQVIIRRLKSNLGTIQPKTWSMLKHMGEEASMLSQLFYDKIYNKPSADSSLGGDLTSVTPSVSGALTSHDSSVTDRVPSEMANIEETFSFIKELRNVGMMSSVYLMTLPC